MPTHIQSNDNAKGLKFAIVVARFNDLVTDKLLASCLETLAAKGTADSDIAVVRVPGAFEIPLIAQRLAKSKKYDAIICLGAVIRGETPHFDYICNEVSRGIATIELEQDIPVVFGVLTTNTLEQAISRTGGPAGDKGADAALTAIEMANLRQKL